MEKKAKVMSIGKTLSPQAAEYYKRLLLVSDRYYLLLKKSKMLKIAMFAFATIAVLEAVFIFVNLT